MAVALKPFFALALENLLIKVRSPASLWVTGPLGRDGPCLRSVSLQFQSYSVLPMLPDPYAANFETNLFGGADAPTGWVSATVGWTDPARALLDFSLETAGTQGGPVSGAMASVSGKLSFQELALFMLDLSSNADQFGVVMPYQSLAYVSIDGLSLRAPAGQVRIFTLPPISWEPMLTKRRDGKRRTSLDSRRRTMADRRSCRRKAYPGTGPADTASDPNMSRP